MAASERDANLARELFSGDLAKKGVHAVGVEAGAPHGEAGFVLIAYVPQKFGGEVPQSLKLPERHGGASVPVLLRRSEPFRPE